MANIIKIPSGQTQSQNLLPFSDISHIKTYCTPHNFTYSMNSDNEWGEYTPHSPSWATTNYWMNENLIPVDSPNLSLSLTDDGTAVHLHWFNPVTTPITDKGKATITHTSVRSSREFTYYIVGKRTTSSDQNYALFSLSTERRTGDYPDDPDVFHRICLFSYNSDNEDEIGVSWQYATSSSDRKYIQSDSSKNYHVFAFKMNATGDGAYPCTLNVDGTSDSFQIPIFAYTSFFPPGGHGQYFNNWDIKMIAVLDVAESDEVIANNVNILRMIYQ